MCNFNNYFGCNPIGFPYEHTAQRELCGCENMRRQGLDFTNDFENMQTGNFALLNGLYCFCPYRRKLHMVRRTQMTYYNCNRTWLYY